MRLRVPVVLAALLLCGVAGPAQDRREMFVFQDNFWLNLHQFLRGEIYRRNVKAKPGLDTALLSEADRQVWNQALEAYTDLAKRDLLFDNLMRRISNALAISGKADQLPDRFDQAIGANTRAALNAAAPIYRARVWPARQRDNEAWIASANALLALHETAMAARVEQVYGVTWPRDPLLVDVVGETGNSSAFTHEGPPGLAAHIQASAGSLRNTGDAPLELLFHEACHAEGIEDRIRGMIEDESARQNLKAPEDLWHATIMFTTGEIARRELAKPGGPEYVPYASKYNQLTPVERTAFERDWRPYLEGKVPLDQALHDLVRDAR
ncbi:MAG TPA: hypothetical protein VK789_04090 [Bryobacteraceae bacterium]|jgi:hypothetical protein|nr:hypothetical protein [Bryobacteraceae bacterium]